MVSAAERLASNLNMGMIGQATELKRRLLFVVIALIICRLGSYVPLPGIDSQILHEVFQRHQGGVLGMFDMISGGSLGRATIFALAIMPYITASIIVQLMTLASPTLAAMKKEGASGRQKMNQYTRLLTVFITAFQAYGISVGLESLTGASGVSAVIDPGMFFRFTTVVTLVGGTMFLMWLGEQITARGIGNGTSLIIFTGIVAGLPAAVARTFELQRTGALSTEALLLIITIALSLIAFIVFMERAQRKILVQFPKRQVGNKLFAGDSTHLPLKLNTAGVIPPIFASSLLLFPLTMASFSQGQGPEWLNVITRYLAHGQPLYILLYVAVIVFFCFFYSGVVFNPDDTADNLKKNSGFIPGIRPGKNTAEYLSFVLKRLTVVGAAYLAFICVMPEIFIAKFSVPFYLGGTGLLIVVNVMMDFVAQVQSHLFAHQYEGLIKKSKLKGRKA